MAAMKNAPVVLLAEEAVTPRLLPEGVPLEEMQIPVCNLPAPIRSRLCKPLVRRANVDPGRLLGVLAAAGQQAWDDAHQSESNVPFDRPAHDRWGVGKIMFVHCDDFMRKMYHMPWWHEPNSPWKDAILPYFAAIGVPPHRVVRCLLARLPSGTTIPVHHDTGLWVTKTHRIHVPIVTDDAKVVFRAGHTEDLLQRYALTVGGVFELNNQSKHYVSNWAEPRMELRRLRRQAAATADAELCGRAMDMDRSSEVGPSNGSGGNDSEEGEPSAEELVEVDISGVGGSRGGRIHLIFDYVDEDGDVPPLEILARGEQLRQTRRSIDRAREAGTRPPLSFVIIGAQKSGTTSVYEYLHEHPLVLRGVRRESHALDWRWEETPPRPGAAAKGGAAAAAAAAVPPFAALRGATRAQEQRVASAIGRFFDLAKLHAHPSCMSGDSTPSYLLHSDLVIPRLKAVAPWAKLIVCMRDPVKRAYSHYQMVVDPSGTPQQKSNRGRSNWLGRTFEQIVDAELDELEQLGLGATPAPAAASSSAFAIDRYLQGAEARGPLPMGHGGHSLVARGLYALQLEPWLAAFPREQFLFIKMEDLYSSSSSKGSSSGGHTSSMYRPVSSNDDATAAQSVMNRVFNHLGLPYERLNPEKLAKAQNTRAYEPLDETSAVARRLRAFYAPHNARLRELLGDGTCDWPSSTPTERETRPR